ATGEEGEAVLGGALAAAAAHRRPGRTAAGHSGRLGRWPMVAAAFAGAVLVSTPFVHNGGSKNVTGMESTGKATADGYASDMPTYEPNDGPASPLVPEPESDIPPVVSGNGKDFVAADGDTVVDDGTGTTPHTLRSQPPAKTDGKPAKSAGTPADGEKRTGKDQRQPADPQKGVPLSLGVSAGLPGSDSSTDSATAALQPRVGEPLKARTDAVEPVKATTNAVKADTVKSAVAKPATVKSTRTSTTSTTSKPTGTKQTEATHEATAKPEAKPVKAAAPVTHDWSTKVVNSTYVLDAGDSVASNRMRITLRGNGNLVISDENGVVRWSSGTSGADNHAVFQADGNFVVYSSDNRTLWSSGTEGNDGAKLVIQADGNVAILSAGDATLWAAGTQH
uniref:hypothetical protein n=1 Tax=Streptomyces sp. GbtcB6 TaxID=2824751 RepID=UPI0020C6E290